MLMTEQFMYNLYKRGIRQLPSTSTSARHSILFRATSCLSD